MKAFVLYHPNSDHERAVEEYVHDFTAMTQNELELISLETQEGAEKAKLYDVVRYPAIIAIDEQGRLQRLWQDDFPLMNELSYFTHE